MNWLPGNTGLIFISEQYQNQNHLGEEDKVKDTTTISVRLTPIFGITIPVIIRVGESTAKVTLSDLAFKQ